ncbi:hypothetical protein [Rhizobium sp. BK251]|uniref:hypothetical protein n=1 Tax=Rhizobium sp. BK251 TaxID=2512125 RepID=UPI0010479849|nr:hypothetical protein [Rhizobium sp. BK251]TCL63262.1 hypothetical protein EV286_11776 [Rhizobium sp. BK251]
MQKQPNDGEAVLTGVPVAPIHGIYWGPLALFKAKDAHEGMTKEIKGRTDIRLLTANVHDRQTGALSGRFDIAIGTHSSEGCAMYRSLMMVKSSGEMHDIATPPLWYQFKDPEDVIAKLYSFLTSIKFFENLDTYADHAIRLSEAEASGQVH